jgi:hypothetical protein
MFKHPLFLAAAAGLLIGFFARTFLSNTTGISAVFSPVYNEGVSLGQGQPS